MARRKRRRSAGGETFFLFRCGLRLERWSADRDTGAYTGLARLLGFTPLPPAFFLLLAGMVAVYLLLVELAKARFYRAPRARRPRPLSHAERLERRIRRRAARFIHHPAPGT